MSKYDNIVKKAWQYSAALDSHKLRLRRIETPSSSSADAIDVVVRHRRDKVKKTSRRIARFEPIVSP